VTVNIAAEYFSRTAFDGSAAPALDVSMAIALSTERMTE
jgi:hypothetical protein